MTDNPEKGAGISFILLSGWKQSIEQFIWTYLYIPIKIQDFLTCYSCCYIVPWRYLSQCHILISQYCFTFSKIHTKKTYGSVGMIRLVRTRNFPKEYQVVRLVPLVFRKNFTNVLNVLSHTIAAEGCFITCFFL